MGFFSGVTEVGEQPVAICTVPESGIRIRNLGGSVVYLGNAGVAADGDSAGYPLDPGTAEVIQGAKARETPVVPAPPDDTDDSVLYARTAAGTGISRVAFFGQWVV